MKRSLLATALVLCTASYPALAAPLPFATAQTAKGEVLTDAKGMTLYVYDKDKAGISKCYGECAEDWPPFTAAAGAAASGPYTLVTRKDGSHQWAFDGKPLYYWQDDTAKGQVSGDGVQGVWHVVHPGQQAAAGGSAGGSW